MSKPSGWRCRPVSTAVNTSPARLFSDDAGSRAPKPWPLLVQSDSRNEVAKINLLAVPAAHGSIGIWPVAVERGRVVFEATPSARFFNPMALVHGGWTAMLLDTGMGCAVHSVLASGQSYATVDLHTSFVRPVRDRPGRLCCEARLLHLGSWIATAEGRVYDATELLLAHGTETCQIFVMRPGSA